MKNNQKRKCEKVFLSKYTHTYIYLWRFYYLLELEVETRPSLGTRGGKIHACELCSWLRSISVFFVCERERENRRFENRCSCIIVIIVITDIKRRKQKQKRDFFFNFLCLVGRVVLVGEMKWKDQKTKD